MRKVWVVSQAEKYRGTDLVTHELFENLLKDEVSDEEEWEGFLGTEWRPGKRNLSAGR